MKTIQITASEYAKKWGCSPRHIQNKCKKGDPLPHALKIDKFGKSWMIHVLISWYES